MSAGEGLPFAHGGPPITGLLRAAPEDFVVEEVLGFEASGTGEHVLLRVEKREANTEWVARRLARIAGVEPMAVGFAGLKDRHAIARQHFTVQLAGREEPDWQALGEPDFRVLDSARHARKLKRGALRGNRFEIILRKVAGDREGAARVTAAIVARGVPNFFGAQRFGHGGGNLAAARAMFAGRRVQRAERSILLSAARSTIFNAVLTRRVANASWDTALPGEVFQLDGTGSIFGPEALNDELAGRLARADIHPTALLWGRGPLRTTDTVRELEEAVAAEHEDLCRGLEAAGLEQERRSTRLAPRDVEADWLAEDVLRLTFELPAGTYATAVLRELCVWTEPSRQAHETGRPGVTTDSS